MLASEIVRDNVTDRLGMAILTTTLLRSKGVPARLALGVRNVGSTGEDTGDPLTLFAFDAWTIAYDGEHWRVVDPLVTGDMVPDRLTLSIINPTRSELHAAIRETLTGMSRLSLAVAAAR